MLANKTSTQMLTPYGSDVAEALQQQVDSCRLSHEQKAQDDLAACNARSAG